MRTTATTTAILPTETGMRNSNLTFWEQTFGCNLSAAAANGGGCLVPGDGGGGKGNGRRIHPPDQILIVARDEDDFAADVSVLEMEPRYFFSGNHPKRTLLPIKSVKSEGGYSFPSFHEYNYDHHLHHHHQRQAQQQLKRKSRSNVDKSNSSSSPSFYDQYKSAEGYEIILNNNHQPSSPKTETGDDTTATTAASSNNNNNNNIDIKRRAGQRGILKTIRRRFNLAPYKVNISGRRKGGNQIM